MSSHDVQTLLLLSQALGLGVRMVEAEEDASEQMAAQRRVLETVKEDVLRGTWDYHMLWGHDGGSLVVTGRGWVEFVVVDMDNLWSALRVGWATLPKATKEDVVQEIGTLLATHLEEDLEIQMYGLEPWETPQAERLDVGWNLEEFCASTGIELQMSK